MTGGSQQLTLLEPEVSLTGKEWQKHLIMTGPEAPCILDIGFLRNGYCKDHKGLRGAYGMAAVEAEGIKKLSTLLWTIGESIRSRTPEAEVFEKGKKIIQILLEAGFAIKKSKVKGSAQEIQFLGVKWQDGQCQIPSEVINKITVMSPLTSKKETQAFLGTIGFWRMHIPEYSQIVSPLYLVTCKKSNLHQGPEQQQAFAQIKQETAHAVALGPLRTGSEVRDVLYSTARNNVLEPLANHCDSGVKVTEGPNPTILPQRRRSCPPMKEFNLPQR
ncbi:hypothetical protein HGM15179_012396 [Zosterops borbonicus]|uniref:Uncharacterized protein n=1 Tax=Zosterops borbonicus TaxID=364589 RepID=A0A8K1GB68_9PASS|nr:hypothetical protein HGM15179_012396 [Zosterops borbonicus]